MDARHLQRIRRKVERGEPLSSAELTDLRHAAQGDAGLSVRLCVAHALSNAEEDREALTLLMRLQRDFPDQHEVELALARSLAGLERYSEAEKALQRALALNPGDPEALKAMALMALRRAEPERAEHHVQEVLKKDPFDGEARLIQAELEHAEAPPLPHASEKPVAERRALKAQFAEALLGALQSAQVHCFHKGGDLWVKLSGGGLGRMDLGSLYAAYVEEGELLAETVQAMAAELLHTTDVPTTRAALLARVRPVLRAPEFAHRAGTALSREGPAGLSVFYVLDDKDLLRYVPETALVALGATLTELDEAAWRHLGNATVEPRAVIVDRGEPRLSPDPLGLWALCEADGYDPARLLCETQQARLRRTLGTGPLRVALGRRELVLVCRAEDPTAVAMLSQLSCAADGIDGAFALQAGKLDVLPPE